MGSRPDLIHFASREAMAARLADLVEAQVMCGLAAHGAAELAVSGGSTPRALYENLAARLRSWDKTGLTLVDERWVDVTHPRSNEAFIRDAFAQAKAAPVTGLFDGSKTAQEGVAGIASRLDKVRLPFDVVILGMGDDGHTASWFPNADGLDVALNSADKVCAITAQRSEVTGAEIERMTLTLSAIQDAALIVLLLAGDAKRTAFERASESGSIEEMPVRAIMKARPDMWVCWSP